MLIAAISINVHGILASRSLANDCLSNTAIHNAKKIADTTSRAVPIQYDDMLKVANVWAVPVVPHSMAEQTIRPMP